MNKTKVKYLIGNKFAGLGFIIFTFILFLGAVLITRNIYPNFLSPSFFLSLFIFVVLLLIKDLFLFIRIWALYNLSILILSIIFITHFLINIYLSIDGWIANTLIVFILVFYTAFIYDTFSIFRNLKIKNIINLESMSISKHKDKNNSYVFNIEDLMNIVGKINTDVNKAFTMKLFYIIGLPFVLLGKGAAYFLTLGVGEYLNAKEYIMATLSFVLIMVIFLFMIRVFLVFLTLKKPKIM